MHRARRVMSCSELLGLRVISDEPASPAMKPHPKRCGCDAGGGALGHRDVLMCPIGGRALQQDQDLVEGEAGARAKREAEAERAVVARAKDRNRAARERDRDSRHVVMDAQMAAVAERVDDPAPQATLYRGRATLVVDVADRARDAERYAVRRHQAKAGALNGGGLPRTSQRRP